MTTLSGSISASATTLTASTAAHGLKIGDQFAIDAEVFVLDAFGTSAADTGTYTPQWKQTEDKTKFTVRGAQLGTTAAAHASGAVISTVKTPIRTGVVLAGAALTLTGADHDGKTILLNHATASVVTLPTSTGLGARFRCLVSAIPSGSHVVQVANATDVLVGAVELIDTDTSALTTGFATASTSDTVTLNHGTSGAVTKGEWLEFEDIAAGFFAVRGQLTNTGNGATPFSAAVS